MKYLELLQQAYKGKKVLLTGHTGFKGSWMLTLLNYLGAEVKGYALTPEHPNDLYPIIKGDQFCHSVIADIRDREKLTKEVAAFQPDYIFHLAAQALVRRFYRSSAYTFEVNAIGTANILESLRAVDKTCAAIIITTDKVYENLEKDYHYSETDKLGGYDPYSASKAAAEIITSSYRNSFFNPIDYSLHGKAVATARAGNVIGAGDRSEDRIIPDIIRAFESKESVVVRNPQAIRPWQHVMEPLTGYLLLAATAATDPLTFCGAWNFGPENKDTLAVREVVEKAIAVWGEGKYVVPELTGQPHEATLLQLDITKAKRQLNWKPLMNSSDAIRYTIEGYKHLEKNGRDSIISFIKDFLAPR